MFEFFKFAAFRKRLKKAMETYHRLDDPWSAEHVKEIIASFLNTQAVPCSTILDVGAGDGVITELLGTIAENIDAVEISKNALKKAKERSYAAQVSFHNCDIHSFHFKKKYDIILLSYIVEYLGFDAFPKKFVWLLMEMTKHSEKIIIIQPVQNEENLKQIHKMVLMLNQFGFIEAHKEISTETSPDLFMGTYIPRPKERTLQE